MPFRAETCTTIGLKHAQGPLSATVVVPICQESPRNRAVILPAQSGCNTARAIELQHCPQVSDWNMSKGCKLARTYRTSYDCSHFGCGSSELYGCCQFRYLKLTDYVFTIVAIWTPIGFSQLLMLQMQVAASKRNCLLYTSPSPRDS